MTELHHGPRTARGVLLRVGIVSLTLATGWIHLKLGGALFALNGIGYFVAAAAMIAPIGLAIRWRWLIRLGLIGYAATAIVAWFLTGPRYDVAYIAKVIELGLIALLAIEIRAYDGSPLRRVRRVLQPSRGA